MERNRTDSTALHRAVSTHVLEKRMIYTGLERYTDKELARMAYGSSNRIAIEMAKRLEGKAPPYEYEKERNALRGAGVNPIPLNQGEDE